MSSPQIPTYTLPDGVTRDSIDSPDSPDVSDTSVDDDSELCDAVSSSFAARLASAAVLGAACVRSGGLRGCILTGGLRDCVAAAASSSTSRPLEGARACFWLRKREDGGSCEYGGGGGSGDGAELSAISCASRFCKTLSRAGTRTSRVLRDAARTEL